MKTSVVVGRRTRVVVFAKTPKPGVAKTRLIPALGAQGAASLAQKMLSHTLEQALTGKLGPVELCMSPDPEDQLWSDVPIPGTVERTAQGEGDLGERMARAVERVNTSHGENVILVGTDCPSLSADQLTEAAQMLAQYDAVILPASDGGYVLIGLKEPCPDIFADMPWSTPYVAALTLERLSKLEMRVWQGQTMQDIDEPADLSHLPVSLLPAELASS